MGTKNLNSATDMITFSRASGGTALRRVGYGDDLVTNGDGTNITGWQTFNVALTTDGTEFTQTAINTVSGGSYQTITTEAGKVYRLQAVMDQGTSASIRSRVDDGASVGTGGIFEQVGTGSVDTLFVAQSSQTTVYFRQGTVAIGNASTFDNISVKEVIFDRASDPLVLFNHPDNIPRIEYDADGAVKGLLIEEARTNLVTYSEDFSTGWALQNSTQSIAVGVTSPDGSENVTQLKETAVNNSFSVYFLQAIATTWTVSVYIKQLTASRWLQLRPWGAGTGKAYATFSPSDGTLTDSGGTNLVSTSTEDVGNGWYRVSMTCNLALVGADGAAMAIVDSSTGETSVRAGDAEAGVYIFGAQLEAGSFPTSYIPTTGSTATRSADIASIPVSDFGYNQDAGSVVVEARTIHTNNVNFARLGARSSYDNGVDFYVSSGALSAYLWYQNTTSASASFGPASANTTYKFAAAIEQNNTAFAFNGSSTNTDTNSPVRYADAIYIGDKDQNNLYGSCHIKSIKYYPRRLTNDQLAEITT